MKKHKILRPKWQRFVLPVILAVSLVAIALVILEQEAVLSSLEEQEEQLNEQFSELNTERDRLERMYDYATTDAYVEQMARDLLGWVKDGETLYMAP